MTRQEFEDARREIRDQLRSLGRCEVDMQVESGRWFVLTFAVLPGGHAACQVKGMQQEVSPEDQAQLVALANFVMGKEAATMVTGEAAGKTLMRACGGGVG